MAFVVTSTGHIWEVAETRQQAVDLVHDSGEYANLTVKGRPMTFYYPMLVAIAETREQVDMVQVGVIAGG